MLKALTAADWFWSMSPPSRELELKLVLDANHLDTLQKFVFGRSGDKRGSTKSVQSTYFDTADRVLRQRGISLRTRKVGRMYELTVKAETEVAAGLSNPVEVTARIRTAEPDVNSIPDKSLRRAVAKAVGKAQLAPVFATAVERTALDYVTGAGDHIEIVVDKGAIVAGAARAPISDLELELKSGRPSALLDLVARIADYAPLRLGTSTKADLGYRLADGEATPAPPPLKAGQTGVRSGQTTLEACRTCFRSAAGQIVHNWSVVLDSDDPEGPHQMRVGLRRLRTLLKLFKPVLRADKVQTLNAKLANLAGNVGRLRDLDVLIADIVTPLSERAEPLRGMLTLRGLLSAEARRQRAMVREELASNELKLLQIEIALLPACLDELLDPNEAEQLSKSVEGGAKRAIASRWRKVARHARHLDTLTVDERHEMRKELKALRYAVDFFGPVFAKADVKPFLKKIARLQDVFGYLNDVALAHRLAQIEAVAASDDIETHRAVGVVMGWHEARAQEAWTSARQGWKGLKACERFWL